MLELIAVRIIKCIDPLWWYEEEIGRLYLIDLNAPMGKDEGNVQKEGFAVVECASPFFRYNSGGGWIAKVDYEEIPMTEYYLAKLHPMSEYT